MSTTGRGLQGRALLRDVGSTRSELERANSLEEEMKQTEDLGTITEELLKRIRNAADPMEAIKDPEVRATASAAVREAARRKTEDHLRHYDVQIAGGLSLADKPKKKKGSIVEMKTGEGKTLTATIPLYLSSLLEKGSWLITVNDYLARRDAEWMGPVFTELGRTVGILAPRNDKGIQPSYIFDPDEERADLVKRMHKALGIETIGTDEKNVWAFDKECWDADNRAFTGKGLERLVEEGIIPKDFMTSVEHISAAENVLTYNYILTKIKEDIDKMKKNGAPHHLINQQEGIYNKFLGKTVQYKKENPARFTRLGAALRGKKGDEKNQGAAEGVHYTYSQEQGRAKLTPEGIKLLSESGLIDAPEGDKIAGIADIAWALSEGLLFDDMPHLRLATRREAYEADITYGPSHEFVFDWLGDRHQATERSKQVQRNELPGYVLLDEVDYILIDDARTPHILNRELKGVPSQYRFYMGLPDKVRDFEIYEWSAARLETELQRCMNVHSLLADDLLPLRDFAEGKDGAVQSQREGGKFTLKRKLEAIRENDVNGHDIAIIEAFGQFMEGVHYEAGSPGIMSLTPTYRILDEGYRLLHELGATPFSFNIQEIEENKDPHKMGFVYTLMQPSALIKHHLEQEVDFIYEPIERNLRLTERGREKLKQRGVLPPDNVVEQCGEVYTRLVVELLPLKHSDGRGGKRIFKKALEEMEGEPLRDAVEDFVEDVHYRLRPMPDEGRKDFAITEEGFQLLHKYGAIPHPSADGDSVTIEHGVRNVLRAMKVFKEGEKYVVQPRIDQKTGTLKPQVILVDENSGRYMEGRRLADGLHEAIEAVKGVPIEEANTEIAKISQQMFYDMLPWVAGMSGTAETSWKEFGKVYDLAVKVLPTNVQWRWLLGDKAQGARLERHVERIRPEGSLLSFNDITYTDPETGEVFHERLDLPHVLVGGLTEEQLEADEELKEEFQSYRGMVESVRKGGCGKELPAALQFNAAQFTHYKILAADTAEKLSQGRPVLLHTVDPNVSRELGEVVRHEAGERGLDITVNILYHENHDREAKIIEEAGKPRTVTIATNMAGRGVDIKLTDEAREAGGLYVPMAQSNSSARNDNQVKGRTARQGDPGSSQPVISVFDPYIAPFAGERLANTIRRFQTEDALGSAWVSDPTISRLLNSIQAQIEARHAEAREHTLDYDKVLDEQRKAFLDERQKVLDLDAAGTREHVLGWYNDFINDVIDKAWSKEDDTIDYRKVSRLFGRTGAYTLTREELASRLADDKEKERLKEDYISQLDKALARKFISQEERQRLGQGVEASLEKGILPRDTIIRPEGRVRLISVPEGIVGELKRFQKRMKEIEDAEEPGREEERRLAIDSFFGQLENHIYSKALFDLVRQKQIAWEDYDRERKAISGLLKEQRGEVEALGEGGRISFPAVIGKNVQVEAPYDHSTFFEGLIRGITEDKLEERLMGYVVGAYDARGTPEEQFRHSRDAMLQAMDKAWMNHLQELESVRTGLRFPDRDPLVQYKREGTVLYHEMMDSEKSLGSIKRDFVSGPAGYFRTTLTEKER